MVADFLVGIDDGFEQVARAKLAGHAGEVGPDGAALHVKAVTGEATDRAKTVAAIFEIPSALKPGTKPGFEIGHGPGFGEGQGLGGVSRCLRLGLGVEDRFERLFLICTQARDGVLFDVLDEKPKAGAAGVVGRLQEPLEVTLAQFRGPSAAG